MRLLAGGFGPLLPQSVLLAVLHLLGAITLPGAKRSVN